MTICHLFTVFACFWHSEYSTCIVRVVDSAGLTKRQGTTEEPGNHCFCVVFNLPSTSRVSWFPIDCIGCSVTEDFETGFTPFRKKPCDWTLLFARKLPFKMLELQLYFMTAVLLLIGFLFLHHFYPYCFFFIGIFMMFLICWLHKSISLKSKDNKSLGTFYIKFKKQKNVISYMLQNK